MSRRYDCVRQVLAAWSVLLVLGGAVWAQTPSQNRPVRKVRPHPTKRRPAQARATRPPQTGEPRAPLDQYARLIEAEKLSKQGRHLEVLEVLAEVPADQQRWEYGFLCSRAAGLSLRKSATARNLGGRLLAVDLSPDGALVAAGGTTGVINLLDAATGARLRTLRGHRVWVRCLKFHPNGRLLASGGDGGFIRLWHVDTGLELRHLPKQVRGIHSLCFSPDGKTLATAGLDGAVRLWNVSDGKLQDLSFGGHAHGAAAVAYSPDGQKLASMSLGGEIFLWDVSTGEQLNLLGDERQLDEACIAFAPDGALLACGYPGSAAVWDLQTGEKILSVGTACTGTCRVAFTPDGRGLLTARDHTVCLWEVPTGRVVSRMTGRTGRVYALSMQRDGSRFALSGRGEVHLLSLPAGEPYRLIGQTGTRPACLGFGDEGEVLLAGGSNGYFAWDLETGTELPVDRPPGRVLAFSGDGALVASFGLTRELIVRRWETGEPLMKIGLLKKAPLAAAFTQDNAQLFTSEWSKSIRLYDLSKRRKVWSSPPLPQPAVSLALSTAGRHLAAAARDHYVAVYDLKAGKMVKQIDVPATAVAFGRNRTLALAGQDQAIRLLKPWSGQVQGLLRGHTDYVSGLAFTPDGERLASVAADGTVRVWAPGARIELLTLEAEQGDWFTAVAFSADGRHLAASDRRGAIHLWGSDRVWSEQQGRWITTQGILASTRSTPRAGPEAGDKKPLPPPPTPTIRE